MDNVVELFKKVIPEEAKTIIIENLRDMHHGKPVNEMCAIRGIDDLGLAFGALHALIGENLVEKRPITLTNDRGRKVSAVLYRYNSLQDWKS